MINNRINQSFCVTQQTYLIGNFMNHFCFVFCFLVGRFISGMDFFLEKFVKPKLPVANNKKRKVF